jgi:hypothetical protein
MKTVQSHEYWKYLEDEWEFDYLTAEACGIGLRMRVDVGPKGQGLLDTLFGGMKLAYEGWNNSQWKTMMVPRGLTEDLVLWGLITDYNVVVLVEHKLSPSMSHKRFIGFSTDEWEVEKERYLKMMDRDGYRVKVWTKSGTAAGGLMNRHVFTGAVW